jgi:hypothetical protein
MIQDEKLHLLVDSQLEQVPHHVGVFLIWEDGRCVHVDEGILRTSVQTAKGLFPDATAFSLVMNSDGNDRLQIVEKLRRLYGLASSKPPIGFARPALPTHQR